MRRLRSEQHPPRHLSSPTARRAPQEEYGGLYTRHNVAISGTHTHAGPAGYLQYLAYHISSLGFIKQTFDAMLDGVMEASWQMACNGDVA